MASKTFFDTNVLVYLFDADSPDKQSRARDALQQALERGAVVISTQVLQEFFVTVTRKLARPLAAGEAEAALRRLMELSVVQVDPDLILAAAVAPSRPNLVLGCPHPGRGFRRRMRSGAVRGSPARPELRPDADRQSPSRIEPPHARGKPTRKCPASPPIASRATSPSASVSASSSASRRCARSWPRWAIPSAPTRRCSSRARTERARSRRTATRRCARRGSGPGATRRRTSCGSTSASRSTGGRSPTPPSRAPCTR